MLIRRPRRRCRQAMYLGEIWWSTKDRRPYHRPRYALVVARQAPVPVWPVVLAVLFVVTCLLLAWLLVAGRGG